MEQEALRSIVVDSRDVFEYNERIYNKGVMALKYALRSKNPASKFFFDLWYIRTTHFEHVESHFNDNSEYRRVILDAFNDLMFYPIDSKKPEPAPYLLACFCDILQRKPPKWTDSYMVQVLTLIESLVYKKRDTFYSVYRSKLVDRLLHTRMSQYKVNCEKWMLYKLDSSRSVPIKQYEMLEDFAANYKLHKDFRKHLAKRQLKPTSLFAIVLRNDLWPLSSSSDTKFQLPELLSSELQTFEEYYLSKFKRKLTWLHQEGTVQMTLHLAPERQYNLLMRTIHAAIVLLYNDVDELTHKQIQEATRLSRRTLNPHLRGLIDAKILMIENKLPPSELFRTRDQTTKEYLRNLSLSRIVKIGCRQLPHRKRVKVSARQTSDWTTWFEPSSRIKLNLEFVSTRASINIKPPEKFGAARKTQTNDRSEFCLQQKMLCIQAAIVRVMKSRKVIKDAELILEVMKLTRDRFRVGGSMIKQCIDRLIAKEYIYKPTDNAKEYRYIA